MLIKSVTKEEKLTKRVEDFYAQKEKFEKLDARQKERLKTIHEAPEWVKTDFWCSRHRQDTTGMGYKVVFVSQGDWCAYYESCTNGWPKDLSTCCKGLRRNITDKHWDDYYTKSEKMNKERAAALANGDLLQPGQEGFITKYGDPNKKLYEKWEKEARQAHKPKIMTKV